MLLFPSLRLDIFRFSFIILVSVVFLSSWLMAELLRENKRMLEKSIRDIERERQGLQNQERKLINEIKKVAKQGQMVRPK